MNTPSIFELVIIATILLGIGVAVWRGGQANPEGTGRLGKRLVDVEKACANIKKLEERVGSIEKRSASKDDIDRLEQTLRETAETRERQITVQSERIGKLETGLSQVDKGLAAVKATGDATAGQVQMIYQVIVPKGMQ